MAAFTSFTDILRSEQFANALNGPVALGMAMAEERGLPDSEKLAVFNPRDVLDNSYAFNVLNLGDSFPRPLKAKQVHAILVTTHRIALAEKVTDKAFSTLRGDNFPSTIRVAAAYALQAYGFTGWFGTKEANDWSAANFLKEASFLTEEERENYYCSDTPPQTFDASQRKKLTTSPRPSL
jgi:hypothetical protein